MPRAKIDVEKVALTLILHGYAYITVQQLARLLGVSTRAAGRILAEMQRKGLAARRSKRAYKLLLPSQHVA
jgi:DNA-binding IclR family transcriptional regulator